MATWVPMSSRRLGSRSASSPANGASSSIGRELQPGGDADGDRAEWSVRTVEDEPVLGDPLHPGADVRHDGAGGPDPVVEGSAGRGRSGSRLGQPGQDRGGLGQHRRARPGWLGQPLGQPGVPPLARSRGRRSAPARSGSTSTWRPSAGWSVRPTRPSCSRAAMVRVIDGGWTFSRSASCAGSSGRAGPATRARRAASRVSASSARSGEVVGPAA